MPQPVAQPLHLFVIDVTTFEGESEYSDPFHVAAHDEAEADAVATAILPDYYPHVAPARYDADRDEWGAPGESRTWQASRARLISAIEAKDKNGNLIQFPIGGGLTFSPMPASKPIGGYLEIGECDASGNFPWEASVEFQLGSDGQVYAAVDDLGQLPALDQAGHPIERCIRCPKCDGESIVVVQVACLQHTRPHIGRWLLTLDGFVWDESGSHTDGSTTDEVAECVDCGYRCPAGELHEFGFGAQPPDCKDDDDEVECAECGEVITNLDNAESSFCGSLHLDCVGTHTEHCEICREV